MVRVTDLRRVPWLAGRDLVHGWRMSACLVFGLAAVLTPLLILFGLKFGLVDTMTTRLVQDPRNREVKPVGSGAYSPRWFAEMRGRREVAFVVERTRSIAATMMLRSPALARGRFVTVELVPTAAGDPLLAEHAPVPRGLDQAVLSASAARALEAAPGEILHGSLARTVDGRRHAVETPLEIVGVLPGASFGRDAAFVSTPLLVAAEDYRDGREVAALGWSGDAVPDGERVFASFRMYADSIFDVPVLRDLLASRDVEVRTRAAEIETVQALDRNLGAIFWIIALAAGAGFLVSLAASLWASVERKRRELGVLRLVGFTTPAIILFPVCQALYVALLGSVVAGVLFLVIQALLNGVFASSLSGGELVCRLLPAHFLVAMLATVIVAVAAAAIGGARAARIEPGEGLREL